MKIVRPVIVLMGIMALSFWNAAQAQSWNPAQIPSLDPAQAQSAPGQGQMKFQVGDIVLLDTNKSTKDIHESINVNPSQPSAIAVTFETEKDDFGSLVLSFALDNGSDSKFKVHRTNMNHACELIMQSNGNLCIYDAENHGRVWDSKSKGNNCKLVLTDKGQLVIKDGNGTVRWTASGNQ
jgi:hypothetical protein